MEGDFCTSEGARRLKTKIQEYWRDRGYDVTVDLVDEGLSLIHIQMCIRDSSWETGCCAN